MAVSLELELELELDEDVAELELAPWSRFDAAAATAAIAALTADDELGLIDCSWVLPPPLDELDEEELAELLPELVLLIT